MTNKFNEFDPDVKEEISDALKESGAWDELVDDKKELLDHDALIGELSNEFVNGDAGDVINRLEDLGLDINDLEI